MRLSRIGVTLIEVCIGLLVGSLLFMALSRTFSSSLQISRKGSGHLTNVQAAAILLMQVEQDISQATLIPEINGTGADSLALEIAAVAEASGGLATTTIQYQPATGGKGVARRHVTPDGVVHEHIFCRGLQTQISFEPLIIPDSANQVGFKVKLSVSTPPRGTEENRLERIILCRNLPSNRATQTLGWK